MPSDSFSDRAQAYEEGYFRNKDAATIDKLRAVFQAQKTREELTAASGITDTQVLDRLLAASVNGSLLTMFRLYPLVEVAWADGSCSKAEADAILAAAVKRGVARDGDAYKRLEEWIRRGPTEDGRAAWKMYAGELRKTLTPAELAAFRDELLKSAKEVAQTSGGVLGAFLKVSPGEHKAIRGILQALSAG